MSDRPDSPAATTSRPGAANRKGSRPGGAHRPLVVERLHPLQAEAYRAMSPAQRIEAALSTTDLLRSLITAQVRGANPAWPEDRVRAEVASRFRGNAD